MLILACGTVLMEKGDFCPRNSTAGLLICCSDVCESAGEVVTALRRAFMTLGPPV